jgi:hypothetical protein
MNLVRLVIVTTPLALRAGPARAQAQQPMTSADGRHIALPHLAQDAMGWSGGTTICPVGEEGPGCETFTTTYCCEGAGSLDLDGAARTLAETLAAGGFVEAHRIQLHRVRAVHIPEGDDEFAPRPVRVRKRSATGRHHDLRVTVSGQRPIRIAVFDDKRRILSGRYRCEEGGAGAITEVVLARAERPVAYANVTCRSGSFWQRLRLAAP